MRYTGIHGRESSEEGRGGDFVLLSGFAYKVSSEVENLAGIYLCLSISPQSPTSLPLSFLLSCVRAGSRYVCLQRQANVRQLL